MIILPKKTTILISGAGATGLMLAHLLVKSGVSDIILMESRHKKPKTSRSIGLHPPSLYLLEKVGLFDQIFSSSQKILGGDAYVHGEYLGRLSFDGVDARFPYSLSCPQWKTEAILEDSLPKEVTFVKGAQIERLLETKDQITAHISVTDKNGNNASFDITTSYLVVCEGRKSSTRDHLGVMVNHKPYPDVYIMGDFQNSEQEAAWAQIFLHQDGLVESLPMPNGQRRWVVKVHPETAEEFEQYTVDHLISWISNRTGISLKKEDCSWFSRFSVASSLSDAPFSSRAFLAGDTAHEISPIGGQGMNLGWQDADSLATTLAKLISDGHRKDAGKEFHNKVAIRFMKAKQRAWLNMALGRKTPFWFPKKTIIKWMLHPRISNIMAKTFTMIEGG